MTNELINTLLTALGGGAVVAIALIAWLGKVMAARITEADKAAYTKEIEQLKSSLDLSRSNSKRISDAQFTLYSEVWGKLMDVKLIADRLWERISEEDLAALMEALKSAKAEAYRARFIFRESQFQRLRETFTTFESYSIGKYKLAEMRSRQQLEENYRLEGEESIKNQIHANAAEKDAYDALLNEILQAFRQQLGLALDPVPSEPMTIPPAG